MKLLYDLVMELSIPAAWVILAVMAARLLLRKAPASFRFGLWTLAAVSLLCPVRLESPVSLVPPVPPVSQLVQQPGTAPAIQPDLPQQVIQEGNGTVSPVSTAASLPSFLTVFYYVWLLGILVMTAISLVSYLRLVRRVRFSVPCGQGIYLCEQIPTPFILGILRPRIYLPADLPQERVSHVLAHERAHLQRLDHVLKLLAFLILCIYWFHPLAWAAYILFCRDMELACDQRVIRGMNRRQIRLYSQTLIECSVPAHMSLMSPLAFGEVGVVSRVKSILSYRKPTLWILLLTIVVTAAVGICFLTEPAGEEPVQSGGDTDSILSEPSENQGTSGNAASVYSIIQELPGEGISASVDFGPGFSGAAIGYGFFPDESRQLIALLKEIPENAWLPGAGETADMTVHLGELTMHWDGTALWTDGWMVYSLEVNDFLEGIWKASEGADVADWVPLGELPAHYNAEQAMIDGVVVLRDGVYLGEDRNALARFQSAARGEAFDPIRVMNQGEDTKIFEITQKGGKYILHWMDEDGYRSMVYDYLEEILIEEEGDFRNIWRYVLTNGDAVWETNSRWPRYTDDDFSVFCCQERYYPHPELPGIPVYADLTRERELIAKYEDPQMLEKLVHLIQGAEGIGFEPKTYDPGSVLKLHYSENQWVEIWLDRMNDLLIIDGVFYDYGPGYHADGSIDATGTMLDILGLEAWPE